MPRSTDSAMNRRRHPWTWRVATSPKLTSRNSPQTSAFRFCSQTVAGVLGIGRPQNANRRVIIAATDVMNAAPRNSAMRNSRSFASDDSITTSTSRKQKILKRTSGIASRTAPIVCACARPHGATQHVQENADQHEQLHRAAPLHERKATAPSIRAISTRRSSRARSGPSGCQRECARPPRESASERPAAAARARAQRNSRAA